MLIADQSSLIDMFSSSLPWPVVLMQAIKSGITLLIYAFPFFVFLFLHFKKKEHYLMLISDPMPGMVFGILNEYVKIYDEYIKSTKYIS